MHILLAVITILSAIGIWAYRVRMAKRGLDEVADMARTVANAPRRMAFRYKAGKSGIDLIEDPREAAALMMVMLAQARSGSVTSRQGDAIEAEIQRHFSFSAQDAAELVEHACWVARIHKLDVEDMRRLSRLIVTAPQLGPKEVVDLDTMLVTVSEAEGLPVREQLALLQAYRDMAGLKT